MVKIIIVIVAAFVLMIGFIFWFQKREFIKFLESIIPNLFINSNRGYKIITLGEKKNFSHSDEEKLDMSNFYRNFYTDFLIIKRYYSFLDREGSFMLDLREVSKNYFGMNKISTLDYWLLHEVTLIEHDVDRDSFILKIFLLKAIVLFSLSKFRFLKKDFSYFSVDNFDESLLFDINNFLDERDLKMVIMVPVDSQREMTRLLNNFNAIKLLIS